MCSPSGSPSIHWRIIRADWRISSRRTCAARVHVARLGDRNIELELRIGRVGTIAADIPVDARTSQAGSGEAETEGCLAAEHADSLGSALEDLVAHEQFGVLLDVNGEVVEERADLGLRGGRDVVEHAAGAHVVEHHPLAGDVLKDVEERFAVSKRVEELPHRA